MLEMVYSRALLAPVLLELALGLLDARPKRLRSNIYTCSQRLRQSAARTRACPGAFQCVSSPGDVALCYAMPMRIVPRMIIFQVRTDGIHRPRPCRRS